MGDRLFWFTPILSSRVRVVRSISILFIIFTPYFIWGKGPRLSLSEAIEKVLQKNLDLQVERQKILAAELDILRAKGERYPRLKLMAGLGPIGGATGNAVNGSSHSQYGLGYSANIEVHQPLYSWGRIDESIKAAYHGKGVKEQEVKIKELDVIYKTKRFYYGYLLAKSLKGYVDRSIKDVKKGLNHLKKRENVQAQRYRLGILLSQIEGRRSSLERDMELAKMGFNEMMGTEGYIPKESRLLNRTHNLKSLSYYLELAYANRPEFRQLKEGLLAKKALAKAEARARWPLIGVLLKYDFATTSIREAQSSPFAYDPFNKSEGTVGIGFQWDLHLSSAKEKKLHAEVAVLKTQKFKMESGLKSLVRQAWLNISALEDRKKAAQKGYRIGKKWFDKMMVGFKTDVIDAENVVPAYQAHIETLVVFYRILFDIEMAWGILSQVVGKEVHPH